MTDPQSIDPAPGLDLKTTGHLIYALFAASLITGVTAIAGLILCYIKRDSLRGTWLASHVQWMIRTFWIGLAIFVVGFITTFILIGPLVILAGSVWYIFRIIKGWVAAADARPIANPEAFF